MIFYTLDRRFLKQAEIDKFKSGIWTERYYGDSEIELVVPATQDMVRLLPEGQFVGLEGSKEIMMIETIDIENSLLKATGISLLKWMDNRFIRTSAEVTDKTWNLGPMPPGQALAAIVQYCLIGGPYLDGSNTNGIVGSQYLAIPNLTIKDYDKTGRTTDLAIPFGPVYTAMREIANTYEVGMTITLESATIATYSLQFLSYKGIDRTSRQSTQPVVRFSPEMDNLIGIKELRSIQNLKTMVYSFASADPMRQPTAAAMVKNSNLTGFDLRALMTFEDDLTTDVVEGDEVICAKMLQERAMKALGASTYIKTIDGEIVPNFQYQYGRDYGLGDLIEVQGHSGISQISRVTEYIRAQDEAGEKAYPTVAMLE